MCFPNKFNSSFFFADYTRTWKHYTDTWRYLCRAMATRCGKKSVVDDRGGSGQTGAAGTTVYYQVDSRIWQLQHNNTSLVVPTLSGFHSVHEHTYANICVCVSLACILNIHFTYVVSKQLECRGRPPSATPRPHRYNHVSATPNRRAPSGLQTLKTIVNTKNKVSAYSHTEIVPKTTRPRLNNSRITKIIQLYWLSSTRITTSNRLLSSRILS